jgi:anti-anti-sigma regulatory factor
MLRVTIDHDHGETVTVKVEGRLLRTTAPELDRAFQHLAPSLNGRRLVIDLRGLTFADQNGKQSLASIHSSTGAEFLANTPLTKYYAEMAQQDRAANSNESN